LQADRKRSRGSEVRPDTESQRSHGGQFAGRDRQLRDGGQRRSHLRWDL